jgi:hypothetical protein
MPTATCTNFPAGIFDTMPLESSPQQAMHPSTDDTAQFVSR